MFIDLPAPVQHQDPWTLSIESRLLAFLGGSYRIAYVYGQLDNSTFRYRVHNMIEVIQDSWPEASTSYFTLADARHFDQIADAADILVVCRVRYGDAISRLISRAKSRSVPVVFDIDDFVFDDRFVHLIMNTLAQPGTTDAQWDYWFAYVSRMGATLRLCDRAITTNSFLAKQIKDFSGLDVAIVPNFLNEAQVRYSKDIWKAKQANGFARDDAVHIGYFSGSPTHLKDFALAESALAKILDRFEDVRVRMVGYLEPAGQLLRYQDRIDHEPFHDYVNLQRLIGSTEINIAPLQDNVFTNCKSELKYFEAAITGTATIASPTHTFAAAIRPDDNGRLAAAHQWEEQIATTVEELLSQQGEYIAMAQRATLDSESSYSWTVMAGAVRRALS